MGYGPLDAEIMIVTDAPGYQEDESGLPIDGRNRAFLYELLEDAGIDPDKCYFTNAVKCKPPKDYKIKVKEMKACYEYFEQELKRVRPKYVLLLGATALKSVIGEGKITQVHGQVITKDKIQFMPAFSPGVAYRDPKKLDPLVTDLKRFALMTQGQMNDQPELEPTVIDGFASFNQMISELKEVEVASFDLETTSLSRFSGEITLMGIGTPEKQYVIPLLDEWLSYEFKRVPNIQKQLVEIIAEALKGKKVVTHNGKFDNLWLREKYGVRIHNTFDTMIASYILDENSPNGLKYLARVKLGAPDWDIDKSTKTGQVAANRDNLYKYLAYDVYYTLELYYYFKKELRKDKPTLKVFKHLMMPIFHTYEDVQMEGVWINQEKFDEVEATLTEKLEEIDRKLNRIAKKEGVTEEINWGSSQQVGIWLFETLKLPIIEKTPTGKPATGESILKRLRDKHPSVELLLERRGVKQQLSFFIDGWKKRMVGNKLYPNFNIHVTVTGRTSSNDPNLQQVPRDKKIRSLIGAPPGWTLVEIDYSQVELRVVAELSGDPKMREVFLTGKDIHTNTAVSISGKSEDDITKEDRKKAKPVNFGFVYGMGHFKFVDYARDNYGVHMSQQEAKEYRKRFFEEYNYLPDWHEKQRRIARNFKQVRNLIGRLRRLPEIDSPDKGLRAEAERQAINSPVQSFASDVMLMSLIEINKKLPKEDTRIIGSVHDAGLYIIRNDKLNERIPQIKKIMESPRLLRRLGVKLTIPLVADVDIGNWGDGVPWNGEHIEVNEDGSITLS